MVFKNNFAIPVVIILSVIVILFAVSFVPAETEILGYQLKEFNLLSDFTEAPEENSSNENQSGKSEPVTIKAAIMPEFSVMLADGNNSASLIKSIDDLIKTQKITGNTDQLKYFFEALKQADSSVVRIAHIGDSIIEGDYISSEAREILQKKFGGSGVGYQALTAVDVQFRITSEHTFSDDWNTYSLFGKKSKKYKYSLNGEVYIPSKGSSVSYKMRNLPKEISGFNSVKILYYENDNSDVKITANGKTDDLKLSAGSGLLESVYKSGQSADEVGLKFDPSASTQIAAVYLEPEKGIQLDNYPYRGNTGSAMDELSEESLAELNKYMDYRLIILQFGLNAVAMRKSEFENFKKDFIKGVKKLKTAFPETSFILMGVSDKSRKKGSSFVTDPLIIDLIKIQKEISEETGIAFWNTFEAMGGANSMVKWVKNKPAYAHSDFTHFNKDGADKIGEMFANALIDGYIEYTK